MAIDTRSAPKIQRGFGTATRPVLSELWRLDAREPAPFITEQGNLDPDNREVDYSRYWDPAFAKAEFERLWTKTWLFAGRDEDIPNVGDRMPLDVGPLSFLIIRSKADEFKAFYNSCLHRGTMLCSKQESGATIRCPYHGWEWNADGTLKRIPSHWDFTEITRANGSLREVRLERWGGFLFINCDPDAPPLERALQVIPKHFEGFNYENRYTAARFRKHVMANWKVSQEAFLEAYHLYTTHPEAVPFAADSQAQYDVWDSPDGAVGRNASAAAIPSTFAPPDASNLAAVEMFATATRDWHYPGYPLPKIDPEGDLRAQVSEWHRQAQVKAYGYSPDLPDAVMTDSTLYFFFPNSCFWLSEAVPFTYQFTPHPTNPEESYFEVRIMRPVPKGKPRPPSAPVIDVAPDEKVSVKAPEFSFLAFIFDQDMSNMPLVQRGMHATDAEGRHSRLARYQEFLIQHWNTLIDRYVKA